MEHLLTAIIDKLEDNAASLGLGMVDEEYGQVEFLDYEDRDTYPVTFPAVLVDCQGEQWQQVGNLMQKGVATISLNIYIDCYDDTHAYSTTASKAEDRMSLVRSITELMQGWNPLSEGGELTRQSSVFSTINHGIKKYQVTFTVPVYESFKSEERKQTVQSVNITGGFVNAG